MKRSKDADHQILGTESRSRARMRRTHSVFEDPSCSVASHHRCAAVAPACSCDSVLDAESSRQECACGHTHVHAARSRVRQTAFEAVPQGVL